MYVFVVEEIEEKPAVNYPLTVFRFGKVPLKAPSKAAKKNARNSVIPLMDDEFGSFEDEFNATSFADEGNGINRNRRWRHRGCRRKAQYRQS